INALHPEDSVAVLHYHDKAEIIAEWTNDKSLLLDVLNKKLNFGKRSVFIDALQLATQFLQKSPLDNRHLVLITDGTDSLNKKNERDAAMNRLLATSISVHVISYTQLERVQIEPKTKGTSKSPPPKAMPDEVAATLPNGARDLATAPKIGPTIITDRGFLRKMRERKDALIESEKYLYNLAESTSGEFILPETGEEMLDKTSQVAQLIDSHYVVTYTPKRPLSEASKGEIRNIVVSSKRQGLQVMARRKLVIEE
ncbi:MAG TPA: VWA domain-containing protein, partial [Pyrinomonadaceae bacterium]|nr:VWA domain-containing protein [Pyrinomonadaceae bacterium]